MKRFETTRGFRGYEAQDMYGKQFSIRKNFSIQGSSLATEDAIWLGIDDVDAKVKASEAHKVGIKTTETCGWVSYKIPEEIMLHTRMHLNREQARQIICVLQRFVDTRSPMLEDDSVLEDNRIKDCSTCQHWAQEDRHEGTNCGYCCIYEEDRDDIDTCEDWDD